MNLQEEKVYAEIREGVRQAFAEMVASARISPTEMFFTAIQEGVERAMKDAMEEAVSQWCSESPGDLIIGAIERGARQALEGHKRV